MQYSKQRNLISPYMTQPRGILFLKRHFMRVMIASRYAGLVRIVAFMLEKGF